MRTYIKRIKSATTKSELTNITYEAFKSGKITLKQYDDLVAYALCREIELGIWPFLDNYTSKETAIKEAQRQFKIKY